MLKLELKTFMGQGMPTKIILLFFILLSTLFISVTLLFTAKPLYLAKNEKMRISNIQKTYHKTYFRKRNQQIPQRSIKFAQAEINQILIDTPINFNKSSYLLENNSSRKNYQTLASILAVLNNLKEKSILEIKTHTSTKGSKQLNLKLSQKRADQIKSYMKSRSNMIFISAIGYGEEIQDKKDEKKYLEITLKRIK
jgi:outer membrane protein OmpA-like peptidoglycan-associated protein